MARATVQEVKNIVEDIQEKLEKLTAIVKGDPEKNIVGLTTEIALLKQRNRFEDRLANVAVGVGSALLVFLLTNGCSQILPGKVDVALATSTPAPAAAGARTPAPATGTASPTPAATLTATPGWTPTPVIYEITPIPLQPVPLDAIYIPHNSQNVRNGPGIGHSVSYRVAAGQKITIVAWLSSLPFEAWLCIDPKCARALALVYEGEELGDLIIK